LIQRSCHAAPFNVMMEFPSSVQNVIKHDWKENPG
jgi:hypothetical protein